MKKQIVKVIEAVEGGARTSLDVSIAARLSVRQAAAYLSTLEHAGVVRRSGSRVRYSDRAYRSRDGKSHPPKAFIVWQRAAV